MIYLLPRKDVVVEKGRDSGQEFAEGLARDRGDDIIDKRVGEVRITEMQFLLCR